MIGMLSSKLHSMRPDVTNLIVCANSATGSIGAAADCGFIENIPSVFNNSWNYTAAGNPNAADTSWSFDQHILPGSMGIVQVNDGFQGIVCHDGTKHYYDLANRGPINSLASFLIGYNSNLVFSYRSAPGSIYLDTGEYYYFPLPGTTLTADVSAGSPVTSLCRGPATRAFPRSGTAG